MRKIETWLLLLILLVSCFGSSAVAAGEKLPISLTAPKDVSVVWLEGNDAPTTMSFSYSIDDSLLSALNTIAKAQENDILDTFLAPYGINGIRISLQIDWAIDDVNDAVSGWHHNQFWDTDEGMGLGYDADGNYLCGPWDYLNQSIDNYEDSVQTVWIARGVNDEEYFGNQETHTPGLKDQMLASQHEYSDAVHIDFTKHTIYFRARFAVSTTTDGEEGPVSNYYFSDWSESCAYGKDAPKYEPITAEDLSAPIISNLHVDKKEDELHPHAVFTLDIPKELISMATDISAATGNLFLETQARTNSSEEWTNIVLNIRDLTPGEIRGDLQYLLKDGQTTIPDGTTLELRCRYFCSQPNLDDVYSEWSSVLTFRTTEIKNELLPTPTAGATPATDNPAEAEHKDEKDHCPICGFCPQPLGLCIFIWIAIIVVIAVVVIIVVKKSKNNRDDKKQ